MLYHEIKGISNQTILEKRQADARANYDKARYDIEELFKAGVLGPEAYEQALIDLDVRAGYRKAPMPAPTMDILPGIRGVRVIKSIIPKEDFERVFAQTLNDALEEMAEACKDGSTFRVRVIKLRYWFRLNIAALEYFLGRLIDRFF